MKNFNFPRVTLAQSTNRPVLDFVLPGLLAESVGMIVGQSSIGKSYCALQLGLGVATGKPIAGGLWEAPAGGPTTIIMGEDDPQILQERLYWLRQQEQLSDAEIEDADKYLRVYSGRGVDMRLLEKLPGAGFINGPFYPQLVKLCEMQRLVIIDPLLFLAGGLDENDNGAAAVLMSALYSITKETGTTILLLHHVGKSNGEREEWAAARGASALTTSVRWQMNMSPPSKGEMEVFGIDEEMRKSWVRVSVVKANYGDAGAPVWLRRGKGGVLMKTDMFPSPRRKPEPQARKGGVREQV